MKIRTILSNLVIILSLCFLTFAVLDWYNPMMNFSGNTISSKLLLVLCVSAIALAVLTLLPQKQEPVQPHAVQHRTGHHKRRSPQKRAGTRFSPGAGSSCPVKSE